MSSSDGAGLGLQARLGLYTATMVVVGSMIGSGIFKKPAVMAAQLQSPRWLLLSWALAGLLTCFGALTNAEIAGMIPETGGQYAYFRRIYHQLVAHLYGWSNFAVIQTASIASIAYVFGEYLGYLLRLPAPPTGLEQLSFSVAGLVLTPLSNLWVKLITAGCIALLTLINIAGVAFGGAVQTIFTTCKVVAIAAVVLLAFTVGDGSVQHFFDAGYATPRAAMGGWTLLAALGTGLSGAFWACDGWNNVTYITSEIRDPARSVPRALFLGTGLVLLVYVIINLAYLYVLPVSEMAGSPYVAAEVMKRVLGGIGAGAVSFLVVFSTFGTANGMIMSSARLTYAMARDGRFFSALGHVHPRFRTPSSALLVHGLLAVLYVFSGTFDQLTDLLIFVSWIFYALGALGVFVLRRTHADAPRPYRVWGYPVVPALFVAFASVYVVVTVLESTRNALVGLLIVALGLPLYFAFRQDRPASRDA